MREVRLPQAAPAPGCSGLCWEAQQGEFPFILQSAVLLITQTGLWCPSSATLGIVESTWGHRTWGCSSTVTVPGMDIKSLCEGKHGAVTGAQAGSFVVPFALTV